MTNNTEINNRNLEFYTVAEINECPDGERIFIEIGDEYYIIFNIDGTFYAVADLCSHDNGPLGDGEVEDHCVICPRHGARFDLKTGNAVTLPAVHGIHSYPVRVKDGIIEIGFPKTK